MLPANRSASRWLRNEARAASWARLGDLDPTGEITMDQRMALSIVHDLIRLQDSSLERPGALRKLVHSDATGDLARSGLDVVGQGIEKTGQKIQQSVIWPSTKDISDGFKIENVSRYELGGSLPETITKAHAKMNDLTQQLSAKLAGAHADIILARSSPIPPRVSRPIRPCVRR
jgi:hypothetical protein